ncbi:unnamed protein product [Closterium sp. Naga37s-1]|nr:unnamed protein product [Closterium sp. Naga37s-1]
MAFSPAATRSVGKGKQWPKRGGAGSSPYARGGGGTVDEGHKGEEIGERGGSGEGGVPDSGRKEEAADGARKEAGAEVGRKDAAGGEAGRSDVDRNTVFVRNVSFKATQSDVGLEDFFSTVGAIRKCLLVAQTAAALNALSQPSSSSVSSTPTSTRIPLLPAARGFFLDGIRATFIWPTLALINSPPLPFIRPLISSSHLFLSSTPPICPSHLPLPICPSPSAPLICNLICPLVCPLICSSHLLLSSALSSAPLICSSHLLLSSAPLVCPLICSSHLLLSSAPLICSSRLPSHLLLSSAPLICPLICFLIALAEDAERAVRELGGKRLEGRPLAVELAKRRASLGERLAKRGPRPQPHQVEDQDDLTGLHGLGRSNDPHGAGRRSGGATDVMGRRIPTRITTFPAADADAPAAPPPPPAAPAAPATSAVAAAPAAAAVSAPAGASDKASAVATPGKGAEGSSKKENKEKKEKKGKNAQPAAAAATTSVATATAQIAAAATAEGGSKKEGGGSSLKKRPARTVVFGGLSSPAAVAHVLSAAAAIAAPEEVTNPLPEDALKERGLALDGCTPPAVSIVFPSVRAARQAVASLHGCTVEGGAEAGGSEEQSVAVWARQLGGEGSKTLSNRVIVRNLPFKVAEADLRKAFAVAGFPWAVKIPHGEDGRPRGFAFVTFTTKSDAAKAIEKVSGTTINGRAVSVGWAVAKREHMESVEKEKAKENRDGLSMLFDDEDDEMTEGGEEEEEEDKEAEEMEEEVEEEDDEVEEQEMEEEEEDEEREARVKSLLDMEAEEEDEEDDDEDEEEEEEEEGSEEEEVEDESEEGEEEEDEEGEEEEEDEEDETDDEEEEEVDWEMEMGGGGSSGAVQGSEKDMMLRVLSRVVEQGKGEEGMEGAGEEVGLKAKGVAVKGGKEGDAAKKGKEGKEGKAGKVGEGKKTGSRDGKEGTGVEEGEVTEGKDGKGEKAEAPPATVFVRNLPVDASADRIRAAFERFGKVADCRVVLHPVTRRPRGSAFVRFETPEAAQAAVAGSARTAKARAEEGVIKEGTRAAEGMPATDMEKRKRLQREKLMKLRSPNFAVSLTRLAVHNVPREIDEKQLKQVFVDAVKARAKKQKPHVKQVKVLREADRVGPDGKPRSKGAAFIEFSEHQHAVAALRALNNHPTIFSRDARPIVEFAIENVSIVKQRQHTVMQQSDRRQAVRQQQKQQKKQEKKQQQQQQQQQEACAAGLAKATGAKRKPEEAEPPAAGATEGSPAKKKQKQVKGAKGRVQQRKGQGKDVKGHACLQEQAGGKADAATEQQRAGVKTAGAAEQGGARGSGMGELKRKQKGAAGGAGVSPAAAVKSAAASPATAMKAAAGAVSPGAKKAKTDPRRVAAAVAMKAVAASPAFVVSPGSKKQKTDARRGEAAAAVVEARRAQAALAGLGSGGGGGERGKARSKKGSEHQELVDELDRLVAAYRSKNYG